MNGDCYSYDGGIYRKFSDDKIRAYVCEHYPNQKENFRKEVLFFIKGKSFRETPEEDNIVNVKNGILTFNEDGTGIFSPIPRKSLVLGSLMLIIILTDRFDVFRFNFALP